MLVRVVFLPAPNPPPRKPRRLLPKGQAVMAKVKLQQIKLTSGDVATQPPFPGGWVLAIFDALRAFAPAVASNHRLPISQRTQERIRAAEAVKQCSYDEIETKLVELVTTLFPKVSAVNGFAKKYVDEYFRLWKQAGEIVPTWTKCLGFKPGESGVLGRALVRDLVLRLCYLESCERRLTKKRFDEAELAFLQHDSPGQVYQNLLSETARRHKMSQEKLAERLNADDRKLRRHKRGDHPPPLQLLLKLKPQRTGHCLLAGIGFFDQLLKTLGLHKSVLRHEFLPIASVFFRKHPTALAEFKRSTQRRMCDFERFVELGDELMLHPGFEELWPEMPDALWRCHLYTLRYARVVDLAQAYYQNSKDDSDSRLEDFLLVAEHESDSCPYRWMEKLRANKGDLPLPPANEP